MALTRQQRTVKYRLSDAEVRAIIRIHRHYAPNTPLMRAQIPGILHDALLLWEEAVKQKEDKLNEQQVADTPTDESSEVRPGEDTARPATDASPEASS